MDELFHDVDIYFKQEESAQEALRKPSFSLEKSNDNIHTHKTKINSEVNKNQNKGKYMEKIKNYLPNNQQFQHSVEHEEDQSLLSLSKRQRNRISAKQSRDRKKLYIGLMEHEHKKLQKQLQDVTKQIQQTKEKINKFCSENKTTHGFSTLSQLQSKLKETLEKKQSGYQLSVAILLDSISFRMGATGRQRVQKQSQCFKQIINLSLPALHRYLMWACTQQKHIFSPKFNESGQGEDFVCPILSQAGQNYEQKRQALQTVRQQIVNRKKHLLNLISRLSDSKSSLEQGIKKLQENMTSLRDVLTPVQSAMFFLFAGKNKYREDLNFFKEDKQASQILKMSQPSKRIKRQEH